MLVGLTACASGGGPLSESDSAPGSAKICLPGRVATFVAYSMPVPTGVHATMRSVTLVNAHAIRIIAAEVALHKAALGFGYDSHYPPRPSFLGPQLTREWRTRKPLAGAELGPTPPHHQYDVVLGLRATRPVGRFAYADIRYSIATTNYVIHTDAGGRLAAKC